MRSCHSPGGGAHTERIRSAPGSSSSPPAPRPPRRWRRSHSTNCPAGASSSASARPGRRSWRAGTASRTRGRSPAPVNTSRWCGASSPGRPRWTTTGSSTTSPSGVGPAWARRSSRPCIRCGAGSPSSSPPRARRTSRSPPRSPTAGCRCSSPRRRTASTASAWREASPPAARRTRRRGSKWRCRCTWSRATTPTRAPTSSAAARGTPAGWAPRRQLPLRGVRPDGVRGRRDRDRGPRPRGRKAETAAAIPLSMVEDVALLGPPEKRREEAEPAETRGSRRPRQRVGFDAFGLRRDAARRAIAEQRIELVGVTGEITLRFSFSDGVTSPASRLKSRPRMMNRLSADLVEPGSAASSWPGSAGGSPVLGELGDVGGNPAAPPTGRFPASSVIRATG